MSIRRIDGYALMQAIMLMASLLSIILYHLFYLNEGNLVIIGITLIVIYAFMVIKDGFPKIRIDSVILLLEIMILYLVSYLFYREIMTISFIDIGYFVILAFILMLKYVPSEKLLSYIIILSLFALPFAEVLFVKSNTSYRYDAISMGLSYAFVPSIIASFLHFMYYRKKARVLLIIGYLANIYYLIKVLTMGNRGAVLALVFPVVFLLLVPFDNKGMRVKNKPIRYYIKLCAFFILVFIILLNFTTIIEMVYNYFLLKNINVAFIAKTYYLLGKGNIDNGRLELYVNGLKGFLQSPVWGQGIGVFFHKTQLNARYPHNLVIQLLYDGGIILAIPVIYFLVSRTLLVFKTISLDEGYPTFVLLFCTSIPRLMFSADIWKTQSFWMLLGFLMAHFSTKSYYLKRKLEEIL